MKINNVLDFHNFKVILINIIISDLNYVVQNCIDLIIKLVTSALLGHCYDSNSVYLSHLDYVLVCIFTVLDFSHTAFYVSPQQEAEAGCNNENYKHPHTGGASQPLEEQIKRGRWWENSQDSIHQSRKLQVFMLVDYCSTDSARQTTSIHISAMTMRVDSS